LCEPLHAGYRDDRGGNQFQLRAFMRGSNLHAVWDSGLLRQLDLPMAILEQEQSAFFKRHYRSNWHNQGAMTREIDVIRKQEGW
jgi:hypothetical protein